MWVPLSQTSFLHEGNSLLCVWFQLNFGQRRREGVDDCLQGNPAVRRTFLPRGKQWLGTVIQAVLTLICKVFAAKRNTRGAVLSIGDPGVGAHQHEGGCGCLSSGNPRFTGQLQNSSACAGPQWGSSTWIIHTFFIRL